MIHRLGRRKYKVFAMDIESHNDSESIWKKQSSMWLGCFLDETSDEEDPNSYFYTMYEFVDRLRQESAPKRNKAKSRQCNNVAIYIFNLGFEISFLMPILGAYGFTFKETITDEDEYVYNCVSTKSCSSFWTFEMKFGKKSGRIVFRDLAKIYGGSLRKVAQSFGLATQKGEIDYRLNRLHRAPHFAWKDEMHYCYCDTRILVEILLKMVEKDDKDFWNSISMASYSMKHLIKRGYPRKTKPYAAFREDYPELDKEETDFLRKGVSGGITYAPERWQFKEIEQPIMHIDAHQMHPTSAFMHRFPYGKGIYFTGKPWCGYICACRIRISYDAVRLHSIIQLIGLPFITDRELVVWDFEIPTMKKCYINLEIEYIDGYAYKARPLPWRRYYADNYNFRLEAKKKGDAFNVLYYKLLNNSSYGKLLEKPHNQVFETTIREDGVIDSVVVDKKPEDCRVNAKYTYLPVGSAIPAWSRVSLIENAFLVGWENVVYFDTDSIFFIINDESLAGWEKIDKTDFLGGWAIEEAKIDRAQFTAPKRYKTETNGKTIIKAGGINFDKFKRDNGYKPEDNLPFDEINIVSSKWQVQRAFRCKGGTLIIFQEKKMDIQRKYETIYNTNVKDR